jgi:hypothetical protein
MDTSFTGIGVNFKKDFTKLKTTILLGVEVSVVFILSNALCQYHHPTKSSASLEIWLAVHHSIIPLLIPTSNTIFVNYLKLSSSTCFESHLLIFRRSKM